MEIKDADKEYMRFKLAQARDAYEEAKSLLAAGADLHYVINTLYYAYYYPVLALLRARGISASMQNVSISLFEKEFVEKGLFERRFLDALRRAFDLKPKCSPGGQRMIVRAEVEALMAEAEDFIDAAVTPLGIA
ncbi:MAG TPA: hypothetical protein VEM40_04890 [Nitrospirota bacterium]|nr:hypothetical protein [Nitrospirota bacterium]